MKLSRPLRAIATIVMLFSLLFAQLAVAAYACPILSQPPNLTAVSMPDMPGCTGMDIDKSSPALCGAHCDTGHQSADTSAAPVVQPFVPCALELILPSMERSAPSQALSVASLPMTRVTSPPMAIQHCCFRI